MTSSFQIKRPVFMALVVSFLLLLHGCTIYKEVEVKEVLDVSFTEFSTDGIEGEVQVSITNPNGYKITLKSCHMDFTLDQKSLGSADLAQEIVIPPRTTSTHTFKISANTAQVNGLVGNLFGFLFKNEFELHGIGSLRAKALGINKSFPIDFTSKLTKADLGL